MRAFTLVMIGFIFGFMKKAVCELLGPSIASYEVVLRKSVVLANQAEITSLEKEVADKIPKIRYAPIRAPTEIYFKDCIP